MVGVYFRRLLLVVFVSPHDDHRHFSKLAMVIAYSWRTAATASGFLPRHEIKRDKTRQQRMRTGLFFFKKKMYIKKRLLSFWHRMDQTSMRPSEREDKNAACAGTISRA